MENTQLPRVWVDFQGFSDNGAFDLSYLHDDLKLLGKALKNGLRVLIVDVNIDDIVNGTRLYQETIGSLYYDEKRQKWVVIPDWQVYGLKDTPEYATVEQFNALMDKRHRS